jgi:hypothetical protein
MWFVLLLILVPGSAFAGHGFMSAFGNIEWLPEPGRTPDSAWYKLDAWQEEGKLFLARGSEEKFQLCLTFAREKLAELEAMVKAENGTAAQVALDWYQYYVERAKQIITDETDATAKEALAEAMTTTLLEHQYILAVIYPDLPAGSRTTLLKALTVGQEYYQGIAKLLPVKKKGALFFKEEEVRWSVEMARRADEENP